MAVPLGQTLLSLLSGRQYKSVVVPCNSRVKNPRKGSKLGQAKLAFRRVCFPSWRRVILQIGFHLDPFFFAKIKIIPDNSAGEEGK